MPTHAINHEHRRRGSNEHAHRGGGGSQSKNKTASLRRNNLSECADDNWKRRRSRTNADKNAGQNEEDRIGDNASENKADTCTNGPKGDDPRRSVAISNGARDRLSNTPHQRLNRN